MSQLVLKLVKERQWNELSQLLDSNLPDESFASKNQWALAQACLHNQTEIVEKFLQRKRVVPLHKIFLNTIQRGSFQVFQLLIATNRIDLTANNDEALRLAIRHEKFDMADALLAQHPYVLESTVQIVKRLILGDTQLHLLIVTKQQITTYCDKKRWISTFFQLECERADQHQLEKVTLNYHDFLYRKERNSQSIYSKPKVLQKDSALMLRHLQSKITHYTATMILLDEYSFDAKDMIRSLQYFFSLFFMETDFFIQPILYSFNQCWLCQQNKYGFFEPGSNIQNMLGWNPETLKCLEKWLLNALGYLVKPVSRKEIKRAQVAHLAKEISWAIDISMGLRQLDLPVLLQQELFYSAAEPMARCFDQHMIWRIMQTISLASQH